MSQEDFLEASLIQEKEAYLKEKKSPEPCFCTETRCDNYGMKYCKDCGMIEPEYRDEHGTRQREIINQFQGIFSMYLHDYWFDRTELEKWRKIKELKEYFN